jgi:hypothetical protein
MRRAALLAAVLSAVVGASEATHLQLPYYDWGACPSECCTYRAWQAIRPTDVRRSRQHESPLAFRVQAGEWVQGLTGVVITYKAGVSKVLVPMTLGENPSVAVAPGDVLLTLHYLGEGYDLFWFKGRTYSDQIASAEPDADPPEPGLRIQVITRPQTVWWVKVKNKNGQVGWTDQTEVFAHMDRCE